METILSREQYMLIYNTSFFTLVTFISAIYNGHYMYSIFPSSVFLSSILYWYKPDYSWRRYFDMVVAKTCIVSQLLISYNAQYAVPYYIITLSGMACYPIGIYYYSKNKHWESVYSHLGVHILINIGAIILYSGKI